jgi:hypothetical protein
MSKTELPSLKELYVIIQELQKRIENLEKNKDKVYSQDMPKQPLLPKKTIVLKED